MGYINFEIDLLRTFVLSVECGSFTRAANLVGRTPSAVSLQIDRLVDIAGQELFRREGRNFALTPAGEQLLTYARRILALNDETAAALKVSGTEQVLRIGAPEDFARCSLADVLPRFSEIMPGLTVEVHTGVSSTLLTQLDRGELDLAIVFGNSERKSAKVLAEAPTVWVAPPEMAQYRPEGPVPLILFSPPCFFRTIALDALEAARLRWRIVLTSPGLSGQWGAVKSGIGISPRIQKFVPSDLITLGTENGLPPLPPAVLTIHESSRKTPGAEAISELLLESMILV
jgi:DNA-binding transcriptional LysR family regulator